MNDQFINFSYLIASICFILALQGLSSPKHARRGIGLGVIGMAIAVGATLFHHEIVTYTWIIPGLVIGSLIGASISIWIPMTKMPERIAFSHAFGGLAAALVGVSEFYTHGTNLTVVTRTALGLEVFLGFLTFTGSLMAFGKLQGFITGAPVTFKGLNVLNVGMFCGSLVMLVFFVIDPSHAELFYAMCGTGFLLGILAVMPIGGADMPVVISLLNSYAGLAASATGFALTNNVLIIAGALDGTSGFFLSMMMSKAMNRSFANVLFGAFGTGDSTGTSSVVMPAGASVNLATIEHAVGGRMPGHMNVLLAEANVPYDQLFDLDDINDDFARTDAVLVVGANDVVNPAAKKNPKSPIFGMPVFNVEMAKSVLVMKRSMNPGFPGTDNELFTAPTTMMVRGDAKKPLLGMVSGVKAAE